MVLHHNLDVRPPGYLSVSWMWSEDHESDAEQKAEEVPAQLEQLFAQIPEGVEYEARVTKGPIEDTVLFVSRGLPADLIIMGTHGKTSADHDSLTERIVIQAPCSVLTIGESYEPREIFDAAEHPPVEQMRFLVPVDFSGRFQGVLRFALEVAEGMPHAVDLLHVVKSGHGTEQEEREVAAAKERLIALVPESLADEGHGSRPRRRSGGRDPAGSKRDGAAVRRHGCSWQGPAEAVSLRHDHPEYPARSQLPRLVRATSSGVGARPSPT